MKKVLIGSALFVASVSAHALDIGGVGANCQVIVPHIASTADGQWATGISMLNLKPSDNSVTVLAYPNQPAIPIAGSEISRVDFDGVANPKLTGLENKTLSMVHSNPTSDPALLGTDSDTGFLFILSEKVLDVTVVYINASGTQSAVGPIRSENHVSATCAP